jgi:uncharacterized membrane protein
MKASGCQRTLGIRTKALGGGQVRVTARAYDDQGRGRPAAGATVFLGADTAKTDSQGVATLTTSPGRAAVRAEASGMVRSFREQVDVK